MNGTSWPPEIDVFEIDGRPDQSDQKINLHYGVNENSKHPSLGSWDGNALRVGEWQEFVLDWTPEKIEMYTDGIKIFQCTDKNVLKWYNAEDAQMWVLIYQSVIGDVEKPNTPPISEFVVDYVRVYKNI